jgi:hypothetical protein
MIPEKSGSAMGLLRRLDRRLFPRGDAEWALIREWLSDCGSVLDVGCGDQATLVRTVPGIPYSMGVDAVVPGRMDASHRHTRYKVMDIRRLADEFGPAEFDCVVALDVLEHLLEDDGEELLKAMERIASKRVVVLTPNGFLEQPPAPGNPHQEHLSGWHPKDFEQRGYLVLGMNGWRPLRGPYANVRWHPASLWWRIALLSQRFVRSRPQHAFHLLCTKEVEAG